MKTATLLFFFFATTNAFAELIHCRSSQTGSEYTMDTKAGNVTIKLKNGARKNAEGLRFEPGQGEDVVYMIMDPNFGQVGVINGEEGLRGWFSHELFESNLVDRKLSCTR